MRATRTAGQGDDTGGDSISRELDAPGTGRLEAFSDGVIAIVVTIMVLELKPPLLDGIAGLRTIVPELLVYLLSFAFSGIYWLNHQHLIRRVRVAGYRLQLANLVFLFCLSLLPFSTADLSAHHLSPFAVQQYAITLGLSAVSFYWVRQAVHTHLRLRDDLRADDRRARTLHMASIAVYASATVVAGWYPRLALFMLAGLTALWAIPNLSPRLARGAE